jgi:hypothetical protein
MTMGRKIWVVFIGGLVWLMFALSAQALTLGFSNITNNNPVDAAIGEAQLFVDVTDPGTGQVLFTFRNIGTGASSICDVYFDDGTLLGIASITGSLGVSFSQGASPPNLPGGNNISPAFQTTAGFLADSNSPVQPNGVNPGEWLGILFNLQNGQGFSGVLNELSSGELRIGIHVQGFASGGSESFVNVPEPSTLLLLGAGLLGLGLLGRKKFKARG